MGVIMKTSSAKNKGRRFQQWVRDKILEFARKLTQDDVRSTSMGASGNDILLSTEAKKIFPFSVECKNVERLNIWKAIEQAESNVDKNTTPIVFIKKNRTKPYVVVDAEWFLKWFLKNRE